MSKRRKANRSRAGFDEDEDAYLVPSDWEDDGDEDDWGTGTAARRAKERLGKLNESKTKTESKRKQLQEQQAQTDEDSDEDQDLLANLKDCQELQLKTQHADRPIWVLPDGHIYLEASSPYYHQAYDFLVAIAEPVSRPEFVHEYKLTPYSLYAAVAVSIDTESIIRVLNRLSKTAVPESVEKFIRECTLSYGKAKLVLKHNKHYIESPYPEVLRELLKNPTVSQARLGEDDEEEAKVPAGGSTGAKNATGTSAGSRAAAKEATGGDGFTVSDAPQEMDANMEYKELAREGEGDDADPDVILGTQPGATLKNVSFRIRNSEVEHVKKAAADMDYPLMEEYDFRHDTINPTLKIDLKANTRIRTYQEKSLSKMFGNGRARSGGEGVPADRMQDVSVQGALDAA